MSLHVIIRVYVYGPHYDGIHMVVMTMVSMCYPLGVGPSRTTYMITLT